MITENEIASIVEIKTISENISSLKKKFIEDVAPLYKITNHDFLSLIFLIPHVDVALSNGTISLFEELSINKKARKFSKGGSFLRKDPVVHAMNLLIEHFDKWHEEFYKVLKDVMYKTFDKERLSVKLPEGVELPIEQFSLEILQVPFIFVKYLRAFFLTEDDEITYNRGISQIEYDKIIEIGERLELAETVIFKTFCDTFEVK